MLEIKLLGIPSLSWNGQAVALPSPKIFGLLCYLAVLGEPCRRKDLLELFWEEGKPSNLRFALFKLRDIEGSENWLETSEKVVKVTAQTDFKAFEIAVREGHYLDALDLWHGEDSSTRQFLKNFELNDAPHFMSWLELERARLEQLYLEALQQGILELEQKQRYEDALDLAHLLLDIDRLNETSHRAIMRLEHRRGNTEAALDQFERCHHILQEELGVEPLAETLELLREIEGSGISSGKQALVLRTKESIPGRSLELIGREALMAQLQTQLKEQKRVLLQGFGGTGKTALAAAIAEAFLVKDAAVLWLQAGDDDPQVLFDGIARAFESQQFSQLKASEQIGAIQKLLRKHLVALVVLDDVWNAYALSKVMDAVPAELPLLVTSRQRYPKIKRLEVGRLERDAALALLGLHAGKVLADDDAHRLCELLGDHAFALRIAGISMAVDKLSARELLERIIDAPHSMKIPIDFAEEGRESVSALLTASLNALSEEAYEAYMTFGILFTSSATPELISLCVRRDEKGIEEALFELQKRGLADRLAESGSDVVTYRLHDLAYSFAKANNHYRQLTALKACKAFLEKHQFDFDILDAEMGNVLASVGALRVTDTASFLEGIERLMVGPSYYSARGHSAKSFSILKSALDLAEQRDDARLTHYLYAKLGTTYRETYHDHVNALEAFKKALHYAGKAKDSHREIVAESLVGLAMFDQGIEGADEHFERAYARAHQYQDLLALSHVLQNLSYVAGVRQEYQAALKYCREAFEVTKQLRSAQVNNMDINPHHFFALFNLGVVHHKLENREDALKTFEEAFGFASEQNNQLWMAYLLQEMGELYHNSGQRGLARENLRKALELYQTNHAHSDVEALEIFMKREGYQSQ